MTIVTIIHYSFSQGSSIVFNIILFNIVTGFMISLYFVSMFDAVFSRLHDLLTYFLHSAI